MKRIFAGSTGNNTVDDPVRIDYDPDTGVSDLQYSMDIDLDSTGRPGRRKGQTEIVTGDFHSLWCGGAECYVGRTTTLQQLLPELSLRGIRSGLTGDRIAFTRHGDRTYYSNWTQNGYIKNSTSYPWPEHSYVGPETTEVSSAAPVARHLAMHKSRMYLNPVDEPNVLLRSEPGQVGLYFRVRNHWKFGSALLMIVSVDDGLFISTEDETFFFNTRGERPSLERRTDYPAFEWSECAQRVEALKVGLETPGLCALWRGKKGACIGTPDGRVINMTERKIAQTDCGGAGASVVDGSNLIHTIGI